MVSTVEAGSAADKAGIHPGDRIEEIDGHPIETQVQLQTRLGAKYEGDVSGGQARPRRRRRSTCRPWPWPARVAAFGQGFLGVLPMRDDPGPGVEVRCVYPNSPADKAGVKAGDRIVRIDCPPLPGQPPGKQPIMDRDRFLDLMARLRPGTDVKLDVVRKAGGKTDTLPAKLVEPPDAVPDEAAGAGVGRAGAEEGRQAGDRACSSAPAPAATTAITSTFRRSTIRPSPTPWWSGCTRPARCARTTSRSSRTPGQDYCDDNHLILLMPLAESEDGWKRDEAGFMQEAVKAVTDGFTHRQTARGAARHGRRRRNGLLPGFPQPRSV